MGSGQQYVIVRCRDAGVHAGYLEDYSGRTCKLRDARRIWQWVRCANTLSELALTGISHDSKVAPSVPWIVLGDMAEIIPCSDTSRDTLLSCPVWRYSDA